MPGSQPVRPRRAPVAAALLVAVLLAGLLPMPVAVAVEAPVSRVPIAQADAAPPGAAAVHRLPGGDGPRERCRRVQARRSRGGGLHPARRGPLAHRRTRSGSPAPGSCDGKADGRQRQWQPVGRHTVARVRWHRRPRPGRSPIALHAGTRRCTREGSVTRPRARPSPSPASPPSTSRPRRASAARCSGSSRTGSSRAPRRSSTTTCCPPSPTSRWGRRRRATSRRRTRTARAPPGGAAGPARR